MTIDTVCRRRLSPLPWMRRQKPSRQWPDAIQTLSDLQAQLRRMSDDEGMSPLGDSLAQSRARLGHDPAATPFRAEGCVAAVMTSAIAPRVETRRAPPTCPA